MSRSRLSANGVSPCVDKPWLFQNTATDDGDAAEFPRGITVAGVLKFLDFRFNKTLDWKMDYGKWKIELQTIDKLNIIPRIKSFVVLQHCHFKFC